MKKMLSVRPAVYRWLLFGGLVVFGLAVSVIIRISAYPWDSNYYWTTADAVWKDGGLHLLAYPETFRGCLFPLIVSIFKLVCRGHWGWRILVNLMLGAEFAFVLPDLFGNPFETVGQRLRPILACAIFLLFWGWFLQYPLSDFPAVFFCSAAIALLRAGGERTRIPGTVACGCLSGILFYTAYNTRATYLYAIVLCLVAELFIRRRTLKKEALCLAALCIGLAVAAIPQSLINHQYVGGYSPKVYTEQLNGYSHDLQIEQIYWGIRMPRYETYNDPEAPGGYYYTDPVGEYLLAKEGYTPGEDGIKGIIKLFVRYPLDMAGIYIRHFISAMTPGDLQQAYNTRIHTERGWASCLSILLWILSGIFLADAIRRRKTDAAIWLRVVPLCVPAVLQTLGAVEIRFFLPVYILMYYYLFAVLDHRRAIRLFKEQPFVLILITFVVFAAWITIFGSILSCCDKTTLLINDAIRP